MGTASIYGVYAAALSIVIMLVEHVTGINVTPMGQYIGYLGMVGLIVCIVLAMKVRKEEEFGGKLTYGQAVGTGTIVAVVSGAIVAVYTFIHLTYIAPEMLDFIKQQARDGMLKRTNGDQAKTDEMMKYASMYMSPTAQAITVLIGSPIIGLIISLIVAIFLKTKSDENAQIA